MDAIEIVGGLIGRPDRTVFRVSVSPNDPDLRHITCGEGDDELTLSIYRIARLDAEYSVVLDEDEEQRLREALGDEAPEAWAVLNRLAGPPRIVANLRAPLLIAPSGRAVQVLQAAPYPMQHVVAGPVEPEEMR